MSDHVNVWMPRRPGGQDARDALNKVRTVKAADGRTLMFSTLLGEMPAHQWEGRWCLICGEPHPADRRAVEMFEKASA